MKWFRTLRWPLRDPAIREARADYRDAQAAIRGALEKRIEELERDNAQLRATAATAVMLSGLSQRFYAGAASNRRGPDTEKTAEAPAPGYRRPAGRHHATEVHPRAALRREPKQERPTP